MNSVQRRLAAHVQALEPALQQNQARMQDQGVVGTAEDPARQAREPARAHVVHGQICRDTQRRQILRGQRHPRGQAGIEPI